MWRFLAFCVAIAGFHLGPRFAAARDLSELAASRVAGAYVSVERGSQSWADQDEVIFDGLGALDLAVAASVDEPGLGLGWVGVFQRSSIGGTYSDAVGGVSGLAASTGDGVVAHALALNACFSWFSVSKPEEFVVSGSAYRRGEAATVFLRLAEIGGEDIFVLQGTPDGELINDTATVLLRPDTSYGLFALAVGDLTVHQPDTSESFAASFSLRLAPIPSPATALTVGLGLSAAAARRVRKNRITPAPSPRSARTGAC
jgi:hypothetical protein